jgi:hypothetical protein
MKEATYSSKWSVDFHRTTQRYIAEDSCRILNSVIEGISGSHKNLWGFQNLLILPKIFLCTHAHVLLSLCWQEPRYRQGVQLFQLLQHIIHMCSFNKAIKLTKLWSNCVSPSDKDFNTCVVSHCNHDIKKIRLLFVEVVCSDACEFHFYERCIVSKKHFL